MISHMTGEGGVKMMDRCEPMEVKREEGRETLLVSWFDSLQNTTFQEEWDTVLFATGEEIRDTGHAWW